MKKILSIAIVLVIAITSLTPVLAVDSISAKPVGEEKLISNDLPSVSATLVEEIIANKGDTMTYSEENASAVDALLQELSFLYISIEVAKSEYQDNPTQQLSDAIDAMYDDIARLETEIENNGAVFLTPQQVDTMFAEVNFSKTRNGEVKPPNTANTRYSLMGPYTTSTSEGSLKYYYVTATATSANSNMWMNEFIPMNEDLVIKYLNAVVDVYVGKVTGPIIGLIPGSSFFPWELLLDPPSTHYNTTAQYTINAQYVTNVKFVWCYSTIANNYSLGVVLNSTSVREDHDNAYVYNGQPYGDQKEVRYTEDCENYDSVESITREYWEGYETIHLEYVSDLEYYYNDRLVTTIHPQYAQGYYSMN